MAAGSAEGPCRTAGEGIQGAHGRGFGRTAAFQALRQLEKPHAGQKPDRDMVRRGQDMACQFCEVLRGRGEEAKHEVRDRERRDARNRGGMVRTHQGRVRLEDRQVEEEPRLRNLRTASGDGACADKPLCHNPITGRRKRRQPQGRPQGAGPGRA